MQPEEMGEQVSLESLLAAVQELEDRLAEQQRRTEETVASLAEKVEECLALLRQQNAARPTATSPTPARSQGAVATGSTTVTMSRSGIAAPAPAAGPDTALPRPQGPPSAPLGLDEAAPRRTQPPPRPSGTLRPLKGGPHPAAEEDDELVVEEEPQAVQVPSKATLPPAKSLAALAGGPSTVRPRPPGLPGPDAPGVSPTAPTQTMLRSSVLPSPVTAEMRIQAQSQPRGFSLKSGGPAPGAIVTPQAPGIPLPDPVKRCQDIVQELRRCFDQMLEDPVTPKTHSAIAENMRNQLGGYRSMLLELFSGFNDQARRQAQQRFEQYAQDGRTAPPDPSLYWPPDTVQEYEDFRSSVCVEEFLDQLEKDALAFNNEGYQEIVDTCAEILGLERLEISPGDTVFDPRLHQLPEGGSPPLESTRIARLVRSGYLDAASGQLLRRATVRLDSGPVLPPQVAENKRKLLGQKTGVSTDRLSPPRAADNLPPEPREAPSPEVPEPPLLPLSEEMKHSQAYVFKLKMAIFKLTQTGVLPKSREAIHPAVKQKLIDRGQEYLKSFLKLKTKVDELGDIAPGSPPDLALSRDFRDFRTRHFVEDFLDSIEREIRKQDQLTQLILLTHLAVEMDIGTMAVALGQAEYDPQRHELARGQEGSVDSKLYQFVVKEVLRTGYVDLHNNRVIRKAQVRTDRRIGPVPGAVRY